MIFDGFVKNFGEDLALALGLFLIWGVFDSSVKKFFLSKWAFDGFVKNKNASCGKGADSLGKIWYNMNYEN